jgi:hypothetical protein
MQRKFPFFHLLTLKLTPLTRETDKFFVASESFQKKDLLFLEAVKNCRSDLNRELI